MDKPNYCLEVYESQYHEDYGWNAWGYASLYLLKAKEAGRVCDPYHPTLDDLKFVLNKLRQEEPNTNYRLIQILDGDE